ncbi:hypothetical protein [Klebsiella pneumoniae IS43]|uniref:Uncharacterized protein n=1 Tax=Klebsiella pneumoniae IS43 TaxID=1432552 RepID=W1DTK1_KLEPN|nr:hypothetical protein [Klebsiella pneumoniae IS43]
MKVNYMALIMSGLFSSGLWAAANNHPTDIEKKTFSAAGTARNKC